MSPAVRGAVPGARTKAKRLPNERMAADVLLPHEELGHDALLDLLTIDANVLALVKEREELFR